MSFLPLFLQTAPGSTAAGAGSAAVPGGGLITFLPFVLILLIMYFLMIRPQSKKQKETQRMLDALKKGDKVVTIGGIHGTVSSVKENTVVVRVDEGIKIEFNRTAIATVLNDKPVTAAPAEKKSLFGKKKAAEAVEASTTEDAEASGEEQHE